MSGPRVEIRDVQVIRGGRAILDVPHLAVQSSEIVAVVGPNGAGKSTLVKVLGLLVRPDRGEVLLGGERVRPGNERELGRRLACVFQSPHLLDRSVRANVELGLRLRGVPRDDRRRRAEEWMKRLDLDDLAERRARTLSGGEAQRVNLARALVLGPDVLLLDEPLGGIDAPTRHALVDDLGPLVRQGAGAGLLVTHDRRVALALGDRVAVMIAGQIRQIGSPDEVFARPADVGVARFVGVENMLEAKVRDGRAAIEGGPELTCGPGLDGPAIVCVRAEEVHLGGEPDESGRWNRLRGRVARVVPRGDGLMAEVDVGCLMRARLTRAGQALMALAPGDAIDISIRSEAVHRVRRERDER